MSMWKDIATAPKDGTRVMLWVPISDGPEKGSQNPDLCLVLSSWIPQDQEWDSGIVWEDDQPTHWMPLPAPPGSTESRAVDP
jgi:hypothetical protein